MEAIKWLELGLGALGFLLTWTGGVIGITRAVSRIKEDTSDKIEQIKDVTFTKIDSETEKIAEIVSELRAQFQQEQRAQDHNFGEVGAAMRQYIANVEKEMHEIEIWGRDHFVLKSEFLNATASIIADIKSMAADIKSDLRRMEQKIENRV